MAADDDERVPLKALNAGVDLHGVCLYPFVDLPDWWMAGMGRRRTFRQCVQRAPFRVLE